MLKTTNVLWIIFSHTKGVLRITMLVGCQPTFVKTKMYQYWDGLL